MNSDNNIPMAMATNPIIPAKRTDLKNFHWASIQAGQSPMKSFWKSYNISKNAKSFLK